MGGHYFITINNGTKNSPKMNMKEILGLCKTITGGGDPKSTNLSQVLCTSIYCLRLFRSFFFGGGDKMQFLFLGGGAVLFWAEGESLQHFIWHFMQQKLGNMYSFLLPTYF